MHPELDEYRRQFHVIDHDAAALVAGLTEDQLAWRERPALWSIADCFNHLIVAGDQSLANIRIAAARARDRGMLGSGPFRHGMMGAWFVHFMDAPAKIRVRSPRAYLPAPHMPVAEICPRFFRLQMDLVKALEEVDGIDLARVKVPNPVTNWFTMSLGQEFAFIAAHERRHLRQASHVRQKLEGGHDVFAGGH